MSYEDQTESAIQYAESGHRCDICGDSESLSQYSIKSSSGETVEAHLCPRHYRIADALDGNGSRNLNSLDDDLQESGKITVRVPKALIEASDKAAENQNQTRSEFVRDALELGILSQEVENEFNDVLIEATNSKTQNRSEPDTEFLENRIRKLESLLEDAIGKI